MSGEAPLLPRIASGDPFAVRMFIDRYERLLWSLARKLSVDAEDAEDAVQEAFVALWEHAGRFEPDRGSEPLFVAMVVRRRLIDRLRARGRRPKTEPYEDTFADATEPTEWAAEVSLVNKAMQELRPEQQTVLVLTARDGLTHEEVSAETGLPLGTVKTHVRRALVKLRSILRGDEEAGPTPDTEVVP